MSDATHTTPRRGFLDRLFGIDTRSLAAFRIAAGAIVCVNVALRVPLLVDLYTEHGPIYKSAYPSLFALVGDAWWPGLLLGLLFVSGALLSVGKWTRVANVLCWLLLFDLHRRNPLVLDGGDKFLQHMLLWSAFLPLGARWSLDARGRGADHPVPARVLSPASAALLLQPAAIYFFSALLKGRYPMWHDGTAAYYAVAQDIWARPFADWVAARPGPLTQGLTFATLLAEAACPLLCFSPWRTSLARGIAFVSLVLMQIGFAVSLELNLFPFISTTAILPFLPAGFWDRLGARAPAAPAGTTSPTARVLGGVAAVPLALAVLLNLESVLPFPLMPDVLRRTGETVVPQGWGMYADIYKNDFRVVTLGVLPDGRRVTIDAGGPDAREPGDDAPWESFAPVERLRRDYRAKMYFERLPTYVGEQAMFCTWVARLWNAEPGNPRIEAVELGLVTRLNPLPGEQAKHQVGRLMVWPPDAAHAHDAR